MRERIGRWAVQDIEVVAAFDVDARKVGQPLRRRCSRRRTTRRSSSTKLPDHGATRADGRRCSTASRAHMADYPTDAARSGPRRRDAGRRRARCCARRGAEILVSYLPVGSRAGRRALRRGVPRRRRRARQLRAGVHRVRPGVGRSASRGAALPFVGDDIKSQVGATIIHRTLAPLFADRGVTHRPHLPAQHRRQHRLPQHAQPRPPELARRSRRPRRCSPSSTCRSRPTTSTSARPTTCRCRRTTRSASCASRAAASAACR